MATTHLQGIGSVNAKPAAELAPGDVTVWNYGGMYAVLSVESLSPKFVKLTMADRVTGEIWERRTKVDFLVGITARAA